MVIKVVAVDEVEIDVEVVVGKVIGSVVASGLNVVGCKVLETESVLFKIVVSVVVSKLKPGQQSTGTRPMNEQTSRFLKFGLHKS